MSLIAAIILFVLPMGLSPTPAIRDALVAPDYSRCPEWYEPAIDVGWSPDDWPTLDRIMYCESKCQPHAYNKSGASGLLQIMPFWLDGRDPFDPYVNLTIGLEVLNKQGWRAWSCY